MNCTFFVLVDSASAASGGLSFGTLAQQGQSAGGVFGQQGTSTGFGGIGDRTGSAGWVHMCVCDPCVCV